MAKELDAHKVVIDEFKGNPLLKIVKVDEEGNELEKYSTAVSFGLTKAKYILANIEGIQKFVDDLEKDKEKEE